MYGIALFVKFNHVHIRLHKKQPSSIRLEKFFAKSRVWYVFRLESWALVRYGNFDFIRVYGIVDFNPFCGVHFVSMRDGVAESLL